MLAKIIWDYRALETNLHLLTWMKVTRSSFSMLRAAFSNNFMFAFMLFWKQHIKTWMWFVFSSCSLVSCCIITCNATTGVYTYSKASLVLMLTNSCRLTYHMHMIWYEHIHSITYTTYTYTQVIHRKKKPTFCFPSSIKKTCWTLSQTLCFWSSLLSCTT